MKTIKAVLFDFDGVLTLDETGSQSICNYLSQAIQIEKSKFTKAYKQYNADLLSGRLKHEDIWPALCKQLDGEVGVNVLYDSFINTPINEDLLHLVRTLKTKSYKTAMVTDNKADRIKAIVCHHRWESLFDYIAVSAEIGSGKDQTEIFNWVLKALRVEPGECVFIDNKRENLMVPERLGIKPIFFDYPANNLVKLKQDLTNTGVVV